MLVGMAVAVLALDTAPSGTAFAVVPPLALLVLPVLDTTAAVLRRTLTGRRLAAGDREHLHHVLRRQGRSVRQTLRLVAVGGAVAVYGAVLAAIWTNDLVAAGAALAVAASLLASGLFGATEVRLVGSRLTAPFRPAAGYVRRTAAAFGTPSPERGRAP